MKYCINQVPFNTYSKFFSVDMPYGSKILNVFNTPYSSYFLITNDNTTTYETRNFICFSGYDEQEVENNKKLIYIGSVQVRVGWPVLDTSGNVRMVQDEATISIIKHIFEVAAIQKEFEF